MKKTAAIVAGGVLVVLGLTSLFRGSASPEEPPVDVEESRSTPAPAPRMTARSPEPEAGTKLAKPVEPNDSVITKEQFEQMSSEDRDRAIKAFVAAFWASELGSPAESISQEPQLSLDVFGRPCMRTVSEREFFQLSPEDQEKVMAETVESLRQMRAHARDIVAEARECMANLDYTRAEAGLISSLETGRELAADKDGMFITRVVGIACQKAALNQMVTLYDATGDLAKVQTARAHLQDLEAEMDEMRNAAQQTEQ